jgi:Zn-dependent protease/CBS domain-containing protein
MNPSIRLGRLFGIEIGANWSLIFFFAWIMWVLASQVLPETAPRYPVLAYWATAVAGSLLFYACLLAHELSHALVARNHGVKVAGITLWLFGGVSRLDGEPDSPRSEALIAGVGPLTSFGAALVMLGLAFATQANALISGLFAYLFLINIALGVFNLVPAFPLDGGRLLSSFLWWRSGSRQSGVHNAVRVGRVFAFLMIGGGVLDAFLGGGLNGLWIAFLGWFLLSAGASEEAGSNVRTMLRSVPVSAAMTSPVVTLPDWVSVAQFVDSIAPNHSFTTYPIHDQSGKLTGVVRLNDLVRMPADERQSRRLIDVARPIAQIPTTSPREDLSELIQRVGSGLEQRVLVFDNGSLVGILSPADVARVLTVRQSAGGRRPPAA